MNDNIRKTQVKKRTLFEKFWQGCIVAVILFLIGAIGYGTGTFFPNYIVKDQLQDTFHKEELKQLIEDAVFNAASTQSNLEYHLITEKELSERVDISKVTLHKFRREGKIPYCKVGRTIRYNYKEVVESLKNK